MKNTRRLVESAVMIALGTILSLIQFNGPWINGGSVTLASMLPVMIIAYRYGTRWGMFTGAVYGILQLVVGLDAVKGISMWSFFGSLALDYIIAFGCMGLAGLFRRLTKSTTVNFTAGVAVACVARFACHLFSGAIIWFDLLGDGFLNTFVASFFYNIGYMGPELLISVVAAFLLSGVLDIVAPKKKLDIVKS